MHAEALALVAPLHVEHDPLFIASSEQSNMRVETSQESAPALPTVDLSADLQEHQGFGVEQAVRICEQGECLSNVIHIDGPLLLPTANDIFCSLQGQVLITAPHSLKLERGGDASGEQVRTHFRERWTAEIALALARELGAAGLPASFMVWNRAARPSAKRLDPNFLTRAEFGLSPWHCALHRWALGCQGLPLLHVDFHGKNEPEDKEDQLDLGMAPLERSWPQEHQDFVLKLKRRLKKLLDAALALNGVKNGRGRPMVVESKPVLNGFWGKQKLKTLSHQSVLLGIPALQFEAPPRLRQRFIADPKLCAAVAAAIAQAFREVVVPWWCAREGQLVPAQPRPLQPDASLADTVVEQRFVDRSHFSDWCSQLYDELVQRERLTCEFQI